MTDTARSAQGRPPQHRQLALCAGLLALGAYLLHFPGQATFDTFFFNDTATTEIYTSNQPPAMSALLAAVTLPGMLALQIALFSAAAVRVLALTGSALRVQLALLAVLFLFPVLLIYMGIVWKDVLFAHGALLAVVLLPADAPNRHWRLLAASAAILAVAAAVRQQAMIVAVVAVLYLLCAAGMPGLRRTARWAAALLWLAVFSLSSLGIRTAVQASGDTTAALAYQGPIRQLAMFDLGGIMARVPGIEFPAIAARAPGIPIAHRPTRERVVEQLGRYAPDRQDYMAEPDAQPHLWIVPEAWLADWRTNVRAYPLDYIAHRLDATSWLLGFHGPEKCLPFAVGIPPTPEYMVAALGVAAGVSARARALGDLGAASQLLFRPWLYAGLSVAVIACLLARGARPHGPVIALQACGLLYAASYLLIGIACDFRYVYFTVVAALFGAAYVAALFFRGRDARTRPGP